ncbi:ankyrin repeat domain-containing protein 40-like [Watersipora subatra]|uniref:ankyrin repeat domain-containing protein 40-like n=1 Tax=Watersipora subatra TaxID=2589382 RepID=UPI00355BABA0
MDAAQEDLREAAACGDSNKVEELLSVSSSSVNGQHKVNGWTALHWAAKRNHAAVVSALLTAGADKDLVTNDGKTAAELTTDSDIARALGCLSVDNAGVDASKESKFVPSYIQNPILPSYCSKQRSSENSKLHPSATTPLTFTASAVTSDELVLKIRRASSLDSDFIEVELLKSQLTISALLTLVSTELDVIPDRIVKIRKLPNTILRKDKDVSRLTDFQEIEIVESEQTAMDAKSFIQQQRNSMEKLGHYANNSSVLY